MAEESIGEVAAGNISPLQFPVDVSEGSIYCLEMLGSRLSGSELALDEIFIISVTGVSSEDSAIPSLSAYWSGQPACKLDLFTTSQSLANRISRSTNSHISASLAPSELMEALTENDFRCVQSSSARIFVAIRGRQAGQTDSIEGLCESADLIRSRSLNLMNSSRDRRAREASRLRKHFTPLLNEFAHLLAGHCVEQYQLDTDVVAGGSNNTWGIEVRQGKHFALEEPNDLIGKEICDLVSTHSHHLKSGKPHAGMLSSGEFYLLFPVNKSASQAIPKHILVCRSRHPIPHFVANNLLSFSDDYSKESYVQTNRLELIGRLEKIKKRIADELNRVQSPGDFTIRECVTRLLGEAFDRLLQTTSAHSLSFRMYNPSEKRLESVLLRELPGLTRSVDAQDAEYIYLADWQKSFTAKTFANSHRHKGDRHFYRAGIKNSSLGDGYLKHREETESELCIALYFKHYKLGTINIESPEHDALRLEIDYILTVIELVETHLALLVDSHDATWLARRGELYHGVHRILRIIKAEAVPKGIRKSIEDQIDIRQVPNNGDMKELSQLNDFVSQYFRELKRDSNMRKTSRDARKRVRVNLSSSSAVIDSRVYRMLEMVMQNMLDNFMEHGDHEVDYFAASHAGGVDKPFTLWGKIHGPVQPDILSNGFESPILRRDRMRPVYDSSSPKLVLHYGLFLVGSIARQLSGFAQMSIAPAKDGLAKAVEYRITIPMHHLMN